MHPLVLDYCWIVLGCLLVAAAGIVAASVVFGRNVSRVWPTYRSWLVIIPLALATIQLGRVAIVIGFAALSLLGFMEYARAAGLASRRWTVTLVGSLTLVTYAAALPFGAEHLGCWACFAAMPMMALVLLLAESVLRNQNGDQLSTVALSFLGFILIGWMLAHVAWIANCPAGTGLLLFLLFAVETTDIAAFTFGSLFGRHLMCPAVSPKKTWEGAIGALAVAMALPWLLRFSLPGSLPTSSLLLVGLAIGCGGQLGDLSVSLIKRSLGVKDMGKAIPGHGGVLDRIDSLLIAAPLFYYTPGISTGN